ncbi:P-loop containing nucleoside triphosphate hydrolase protein [Fusarium oxysporum]|nr:P-loop containing nucleoside triphosphate hydrolase protein [Fusarium oxysporum]
MASTVEEGEVLSLLLNSIGLGLFVPIIRPLHRYFTSLGLSPFVAITVLFAPWIIYKAIPFMCGYLMITVEISPGDLVRAAEYLSIEKASWGRDTIAMLSRTTRNELEIGDKKPGKYTTFSWRSMQKTVFYPLSSSWFWADGKLFRIQGRRVTDYYNAARSDRIEYSLSCFGNSAEPIKEILQTSMNDALKHEMGKTSVWYPKYQSAPQEWTKLALRASRSLGTLAIDSKIREDLLADINRYLQADSMKYYHKRGIPYRRGYLFHGPPGTGKTSLVHVIASVFGLPIFCLSLCAMALTDDSLISLTTNLPRRGILLIEDIDSAGLLRTSSGSEHGVTLSGYLNATDGFSAPEGHILVITTNNRDSLDPAILRPGRVDYEVHLTNASRSQIEQLFRSNYRSDNNGDIDSMAREFADRVPEFQLSPAEIQQYLLRLEYQNSPETAIEEIATWLSKREPRPGSLGLRL